MSPFGSYYTDLFLPTSDIDVVIIGNFTQSGSSLRRLAAALIKKGLSDAASIKVISKARVLEKIEMSQYYCDFGSTFNEHIDVFFKSSFMSLGVDSDYKVYRKTHPVYC